MRVQQEIQEIIDGLTKRLVHLETGIQAGDLVVHKTDLDVKNPYVVTNVVFDIPTKNMNCVCSTQDNTDVTFRVIEVSKLSAEG